MKSAINMWMWTAGLVLIFSLKVAGATPFDQGATVQQRTNLQISSIRQSVLKRCGLSSDVAEDKLPWYFHYEFALELLDAQFPEKALTLFQRATVRRVTPKRNARMYGMWFVDYLPYHNLASTHAQLGNWDCAAAALQMSEQFEELQDYEQLRRLIRRNVGAPKQGFSFEQSVSREACGAV